MSDIGDSADTDAAVYRAVLQIGAEPDEPSAAAVAARLGLTTGDVDKVITRLVELGLVRTGPGEQLVAVSPALAEAAVLGAEDLDLAARRTSIEQRRDSIRRLVPAWNRAFGDAWHDAIVDVVTDQDAITNVLMHHADRAERELLSISPGRAPTTRFDGRTRLANAYSARRGVLTRALYHHSALRDRPTRDYLTGLARSGARVRIATSVAGRSLVVDRSLALLPIPGDDPGRQGLAVVREPTVVAWLVTAFEQLWAEAQPLEAVLHTEVDDAPELDATRAAILRLMGEGEKDDAIARRLAISVRTCRRHIADYMTQVGATSRFQAGVIAARAGHTDLPTS